jgi:hypothetical protein
MKFEIEAKKVNNFFDSISDLDKDLTDRIADLHNVKGGMQARHAYCYYRKQLWDARDLLKESLKEIKTEK